MNMSFACEVQKSRLKLTFEGFPNILEINAEVSLGRPSGKGEFAGTFAVFFKGD